MSFHNNPDYHIPELIEALKAHRLPHDTPSQLADSFRIGWMACCRELAQADSAPAVSDLPPLPAPDLRDVGTKPQEIKEFLKGYATEYARTAIAARAPADNAQEDAAREAIEKVLALFPFNVPTQKFTVNNGPCLTADNDDEFYSVKRVLAFLTEIKTTLDAARKQGGL